MIPLPEVNEILESIRGRRVIVMGDIMLDHYLWGKTERISPEAPVPVVEVKREEYRLGGAANVVHNIASLGAVPLVIGLTGNDDRAAVMRTLLQEQGIDPAYLVADGTRPPRSRAASLPSTSRWCAWTSRAPPR
jgi:rfaE bifunctional protein kinase chain/domain